VLEEEMITGASNMFRNDDSTHNSTLILRSGQLIKDEPWNLSASKGTKSHKRVLTVNQFSQVDKIGKNLS
jgi:hypothetical protein